MEWSKCSSKLNKWGHQENLCFYLSIFFLSLQVSAEWVWKRGHQHKLTDWWIIKLSKSCQIDTQKNKIPARISCIFSPQLWSLGCDQQGMSAPKLLHRYKDCTKSQYTGSNRIRNTVVTIPSRVVSQEQGNKAGQCEAPALYYESLILLRQHISLATNADLSGVSQI